MDVIDETSGSFFADEAAGGEADGRWQCYD